MKINLKKILTTALMAAALASITATAAPGHLYVAALDTSILTFTPGGTGSTFVFLGLIRPRGVAFDTSGNLLVSNLGDTLPTGGSILKIAPNGTQSPFVAGLDQPSPIAFDSDGNLYAASSSGSGTVYKINPAGGVSVFATFVGDQLFGLAFDSAGNLFVGDSSASTVFMITPTGTVSIFASILDCSALAFDSAGNLYAGQSGFLEGSIFKIDPAGNVSTFATVVDGIHGLAFDARGNLFVGGRFSHNIYKIAPDGTVTVFASGLGNTIFDGPNGLAFEQIPTRRPHPTPPPHPTPHPSRLVHGFDSRTRCHPMKQRFS